MPEDYFLELSVPNSGFGLETNRRFFLTSAGRKLVWQDWDDVYILYQPSSTETHVFNDITAIVLQSLEKGALTMSEVVDRTVQELDLDRNGLSSGDLSFAIGRLEELGLIESLDTAAR
jgi:PqqD family protein of HPr-rel-A system